MKIAYLAWGSLLWNNETLNLSQPWKKTNVQLPINFSRVSDNGKGSLTLVIDNENGILNPTWYSPTKITNLDEAINTLRKRENTKTESIGYINSIKNTHRSNLLTPEQINELFNFAKEKKIDSIVWTDIPPNFPKVFNKNFSNELAIKYVESKKDNTKLYSEIIDYIFRTKIFGNIKTPVSKYIIDAFSSNAL